MKIALDAMGGDHAPGEVVAGAISAVEKGLVETDHVVLVGDEGCIDAEFEGYGGNPGFTIVHAPEVIAMDEHPGLALRRKRKSSIFVGSKLLRDKSVDAFVSAGNTGAMVAAGTLLVKTLPGVRRPGIAATFATARDPVTLIDVGANIHCQPEDLYAYGQMGVQYRIGIDGLENPRIGLLSIGEEDAKGGPLIKKTRELFAASPLNFIGNIEGQDVFSGRCDVIVCEGFVGNVVLKVSEGLGSFITGLLTREATQHTDTAEGSVWRKVASALMAKTDFAEYGGAPLLGVDGLIIICHGRSDKRAIANALRVSRQFLDAGVNQQIIDGLARGPALSDRANGGEPEPSGQRSSLGEPGDTA